MSGGSHNYIYIAIQNELCGEMRDAELNDLMNDIANLAKSLEWCDSCDTSEKDYFKDVKEFKDKWFRSNRDERLREYVDRSIKNLREELHRLINT